MSRGEGQEVATGIGPAETSPADLSPADVSPADMSPADMSPADMSPADMSPADIDRLIGVEQYPEEGEFPVEQGYIWTTCSSVENGNPLFWDEEVAAAVTGGPIAPPTMASVWFRPHHWAPGRIHPVLPLQVHFDLKQILGLPEAVISENTMIFHEPVRPGDRLRTHQILRSVSGEKTTRLGIGRFWGIDVEYHNQRGDLVAVESYTAFGYRRPGQSGVGQSGVGQ